MEAPTTTDHGIIRGARALALIGILAGSWVPFAEAKGRPSNRPTGSDSGNTKMSVDLRETVGALGSGDTVQVIVQTRNKPRQADFERVQSVGGTVVASDFTLIRGYVAVLPVSGLTQLVRRSEVLHVSPDRTVFALAQSSLKPTKKPDSTGRPPKDPGGPNGGAVTVAVVDSGISPNPDLTDAQNRDRVVVRETFSGAGALDGHGHGQHVAGIIAGSGAMSSTAASYRTFRGMAPGAELVSLKVLDASGVGRASGVLQALESVVANRRQRGIRIVNLSLGHPAYESFRTDPLCVAVERLVASGVVVVVAAGNDGNGGYGTISSPGIAPSAITVGALDDAGTEDPTDDRVASYSSRGPSAFDQVLKPDLVAPGDHVISLRTNGSLDERYPANRVSARDYTNDPSLADQDGAYFVLSGSSVATAAVSGAVALLLENDPSLDPPTVKARLLASARTLSQGSAGRQTLVHGMFPSPYVDATGPQTYRFGWGPESAGAGALDVAAALAATGTAVQAPSPRVLRNSLQAGALAIEEVGTLWGGTSPWSTSVLWEGSTAWVNGSLWSNTPLWSGAVLARSAESLEDELAACEGVLVNGD